MNYLKKYFVFIFLGVLLIGFFSPFLVHGRLPIPSDTIVGLYHPYRDFYADTFPRGIPFKNFLITDPVRQEYPWRYLAVSIGKMAELPLWNPYSFAGYPLLGNFQSAPFYPLNILLYIFPFAFGWSLLVVLQPVLGGLFLYAYLRNVKLHRFASLLGSLSFIFSGFFISWLEWNTVVHVVIWLPLILLAKDKLLKKWTITWGLIFLFAECAAVFAGHLQVLFYAISISNAYLFAKIIIKAKKEDPNHLLKKSIYIYLPFLFIGMLFVVITAIQWLPTWQFISFSARDVDQNYLTQTGWFVPWQHLIQFVIPDFFGNPTTLNYWGTWNYAELVGYIGIFPLIMALFALLFRRDKKTYFFAFLAIAALLFCLPTPIALLPYALHIPLLSSSQPTRLLFVVDFCLAILAALGLDAFIKKQKGIQWILGGFFLVFVGMFLFIMKGQAVGISAENLSIAKHNIIFPFAIFSSIATLLLFYTYSPKRKHYRVGIILLVILVITAYDLLRFATKFTPFTNQTYLFPTTKTLTFLQKNLGNYRFMTTDDRILPPNFSVMYQLQSVDGYDPLYLRRYAELISAAQRGKPDVKPPFGFNRIITPHTIPSRIMNLLGVKYVISLTQQKDPSLMLVVQEGQTQIYENKNALPRAFFVTTVRYANQQEAIEFLFDTNNDLQNEAVVAMQINSQQFGQGNANITSYSSNRVIIQTQNNKTGFLVLSDMYYPSWHVRVDGKEEKIYITDFAFRGVIVPAGHHTVVYQDKIL